MPKKKATVEKPKFLVLRDTAEHEGKGWYFSESEDCLGTIPKNLYTGDYSLEGFYDNKTFVIERKGNVTEFIGNITNKEKWDDFKQELERLEEFVHPFIICEFPYSLIERFPMGSGMPRRAMDQVRVRPAFLVKRLWEIQMAFKTKILFADAGGQAAAFSLFKRMVEKYGDR